MIITLFVALENGLCIYVFAGKHKSMENVFSIDNGNKSDIN